MTIYGMADDRSVWMADGFGPAIKLSPEKSQKIFNHSPDGFEWGYNGSGPAQLALAILLELFGERVAMSNYGVFKREVISLLPRHKDFKLESNDIMKWVRGRFPVPFLEG